MPSPPGDLSPRCGPGSSENHTVGKWIARGTAVIVAGIVLIALVVLISNLDDIGAFLGSMAKIGPGHSQEDKASGLAAFGIVLISILALAKIVAGGRQGQ